MLRKRLVLGTYAFMLPKHDRRKREAAGDPSTHEWICLLRCFDPLDDITRFVKKAVFSLHPSFAQPVRVVEADSGSYSPFQVDEVGWGEFEISCKIYFHLDVDTKPIEFKHYLRLYPEGTADIASIAPPEKYRQNCVVSETHDEVIFKCTSAAAREALAAKRASPERHPLSEYYGKGVGEEEDEYIAMHRLLKFAVNQEVAATKQRLLNKALEVQGLMNIYYTLRPDRALDLLAQYPKLLSMTAGDAGAMSEEEKKELEETVRKITRTLHTEPDTFAAGKEKAAECIQLFNELVQKGLIVNADPPLPLASHR